VDQEPHVWQGEAGSSVGPTITRRAPTPPIEAAKRVAEALDIWQDGMAAEDAKMKIADKIERIYKHVGMPTRLHELNIPKEDFPILAKETVKVFNANAGVRDADQQMKSAMELLEAAW
jgi:alcohol dehydrogenase class IV